MIAPKTSQIVKPYVLPALNALIGPGRPFLRIGAVSGASALAVHWYYFHVYQKKNKYNKKLEDIYSPETFGKDMKQIFFSVNMFHLCHSVVLLSIPLCPFPVFVCIIYLNKTKAMDNLNSKLHFICCLFLKTGCMHLIGISMFCGSGYYKSFGGTKNARLISGIGGGCLFFAWTSMVY